MADDKQGVMFTRSAARRVAAAVRRMESADGASRRHWPLTARPGRIGIVTASEADGEGRMTYTVQQAEKSGEGYDAWQAVEGGWEVEDVRLYEGGTTVLADGAIVRIFPHRVNDDIIEWWASAGVAGTADDPLIFGPKTPDTETAPTNSWDITEQGAHDGVVIPIIIDVAYDEAGDHTLYGIRTEMTVDSSGRIIKFTQPTRFTIDAPVVCSVGGG